MQFLYLPLTWGFLLVLLPLLIHLINLTRQRRVEWAAMEFLLEAYKKHRRWVWMRQMLLLAARMLAIAVLVAMLAHLVTRSQWAQLLGGSTTHHIVLLDDTLSMSDQAGHVTPFQKAESVVKRLAERIDSNEWGQKLTLIRWTQAARMPSTEVGVDPVAAASQAADFYGAAVDGEFAKRIETMLTSMNETALSATPAPALRLATELADTLEHERPVVYLVSDFRSTNWEQPAEVLELVRGLEEKKAHVNFVRCAEDRHTNIAITRLVPAEGTRAAGVPVFMDLSVTNFGEQVQELVPVAIQSQLFRSDTISEDPLAATGTKTELPSVLFDRIEPGETAVRRFQVYFPTAGHHVVSAQLPADSVAVDNRRFCVVDFPIDIPVALIDGDPERRNATYLTSVFRPSQRVLTGLRPEEKSVAFLRDASEEQLDEFHVIYLMDVASLDSAAMTNLESFVRRGGGVAIFVGPHTNLNFYRQWYNNGAGMYPVPLQRIDLNTNMVGNTPSLIVEQHPVFRVLLGEGNPFASQVRIQQFIRPQRNWQPADQSTTRFLARLGNGSPLAVEKTIGTGKVVTFLTTLAPLWNTWAMQPSFVVTLLELQGYLDGDRSALIQRHVGSPIEVDVDTARNQPQVIFVVPDGSDGRKLLKRTASVADAGTPLLKKATLGTEIRERIVGRTDRPGIYEAWQRGIAGEFEVHRFALNVDTVESDLALIPNEVLADRLSGTDVRFLTADALTIGDDVDEGIPWSQYLFWILVVLLLVEQLLGFLASYHLPARSVAR